MKPFPSDPALLRGVALLADLADGELEWLAAHGQWLEFEHDEHVIRRGDPADSMALVLEGELQARMPETGDEVVFRARTGDVTGLLPFSRMTEYPAESRSFGTTRLVRIAREDFPEMLRAVPVLEGRLVGLMTDRVRETTRRDEQREKLMALGRLSAGLAHELNNPAAAAMRAAHGLGQALSDAQR
ncbi:MAG TPA: cyclic nucleotide-binding domain-containing protein, partial [Longimicrobiaceae bacterium]|nr:cyclic nucleotide-binding domain-containing protein [Longimicrobiaceae bacterium]